MATTWSNWGNNLHYRDPVVRPRNIEEVSSLVKQASKVQAFGSGHSFLHAAGPSKTLISSKATVCQEGGILLDLTHSMNRVLSIDEASWTCTVEGGCTFETLARALEQKGLALENVPSLLVVTVAGAVLTGTHGCGTNRPILADLVQSMTVVRADGSVAEIKDKRFFVHLGLLGVVVRLTLRCVPFYRVRQCCYERIPLSEFLNHAEEFMCSASHTQLWVDFSNESTEDGEVMAWLRNRCGSADPVSSVMPPTVHPHVGGTLRFKPVPITEAPDWPIHATGEGNWYDMLPFFRLGSTLPIRESVQTEFFIHLSNLKEALGELSGLAKETGLGSIMSHGCELRPILGDDFTLSPCNRSFSPAGVTASVNSERPVFVAMHFTIDLSENDREGNGGRIPGAIQSIQARLSRFNARPHWGKLFDIDRSSNIFEMCYGPVRQPCSKDFWEEVLNWDPHGKFRNAMFDKIAHSKGIQSKM
eukprot:TRINITY_DN22785_c0_g1_i1.p1 TRINITY_DN22785_c0_g1~~TRINITY_DN22785_c0_g1_i1.p1  ORF type:complete len:474 (-),score=49.65 TRINITY_DN22785_c0_g1_i1:101-1522(-)